ncbi:protein HEG homolog 1 isoform X2 [Ambystoma mexicanum]|uniref:protein HEG homolog 1 isoform X2 n=1 Tax=Ambystoma mexicanum TaxID=8296 RepID=UPI0037E71FAD
MVPRDAGQSRVQLLLLLLFLLPPSHCTPLGFFSAATEQGGLGLSKRWEGSRYSIPPPSYTPPTTKRSDSSEATSQSLLKTGKTNTHPRIGTETPGAIWGAMGNVRQELRGAELQLGPGHGRTWTGTTPDLRQSENIPSEGERATDMDSTERSEVLRASEPVWRGHQPLSVITGTEVMDPSAMERTTSEPERASAMSELERRKTQTRPEVGHAYSLGPPQPGRTEPQAGIRLEHQRTKVMSPPSSGYTHSGVALEPERSGLSFPSEPERSASPIHSEPKRSWPHITPEPERSRPRIPSQPERSGPFTHSGAEKSGPLLHSELQRSGPQVTSQPRQRKVLVPSASLRTEVVTQIQLEPSKAEAHTRAEPESTEVRTPSEHASLESESLEVLTPSQARRTKAQPQSVSGRIVGADTPSGRVGHDMTHQTKAVGGHTTQEAGVPGVQTQWQHDMAETQTGPDKKGTETPPEPGGTRSLHGRAGAEIWTSTGDSNPDQSPPERGALSPAVTLSEAGAHRVLNVSEPLEARAETASHPGVKESGTPSGTWEHITRIDGDNVETAAGVGEEQPQTPSEPGGALTQTSSGPEPGKTATETEHSLVWTDAADRPRDPDLDWTSIASVRLWTGTLEQTEVLPVSASESRLVSDSETGNGLQPVSINDVDKRTSLSHTDSMYLSTTYSRGGERTLLSITNGSTSVDITESSVYYNISKTSDSPDSSSMEDGEKTRVFNGDADFSRTSWERFLIHSSNTSTHSSQTYNPATESSEPVEYSQKPSDTGSNTADPSMGSGVTTSRSDYGTAENLGSTPDSMFSLLNSSPSAPSSTAPVPISSTSIESISSSFSEPSTPFISSASSTYYQLSSLSTSHPPMFSSPPTMTSIVPVTSSMPVLTMSPYPVPSSFSADPPNLSTTSFFSSLSSRHPLQMSSFSTTTSSPESSSLSPSSSPSSASLPGESLQTSPSPVAAQDPEDTVTVESSSTLYHSSKSTDSGSHNDPPLTEGSPSLGSTQLPSPSAFTTERFNRPISATEAAIVTKSFTEGNITFEDGAFVDSTTVLAPTISSTQETHHIETPEQATNSLPYATKLPDLDTTSQLSIKKTAHTVSRTFESHSIDHTTGYVAAIRTSLTEAADTMITQVRGMTTPDLPPSTAKSTTLATESTPSSASYKTPSAGRPPSMSPTIATKSNTSPAVKSTPVTSQTSVSLCSANPCFHGGKCIVDHITSSYRCLCLPSWTGEQCSTDVDECLSNPCPPKATCINAQGSFTCRCPLGYQLEKGAGCSLARTFIGQIKISSTFVNSSDGRHLQRRDFEGEVLQMFRTSLSVLDGYNTSSILDAREAGYIVLSVQHVFSLESKVTIYDVMRSLQSYMKSCEASEKTAGHCELLTRYQLYYKADSLCHVKFPECDRETSECTDLDGIALCQCRAGYFKYSKMDYSCRACEDGYKRENGTCVRCPFGMGGFNCGNPYQLITIVIAAAGGGLLLILGTALIVTCCRKNKNDISKLIFKSGDFQMSPYAEYPKNPRSSEWGREAIEMQENGSTKNLLQMTDVYYPPGLRNPELERNGLYPIAGVPGSRHSCIYPGQYNPTFLNEERRRDYF